MQSEAAGVLLTVLAPDGPPLIDAGGEVTISVLDGAEGRVGTIVVNNDEWTLSDTGFANAPTAANFALNLANWFKRGPKAKLLVYSSNFGLTGARIATTIRGAGHEWVVRSGAAPTLAELLLYDAVFLCGLPVPTGTLNSYVNEGGSIYLCGQGYGQDQTWWNPFLAGYGLRFGPANPVVATVPVNSTHPLLAGVTSLFYYNGNDVELLPTPNVTNNEILHKTGIYNLISAYTTGRFTVDLTGSLLTAGSGGSVTYTWSFVEGPGLVRFQDSAALQTRAYFSAAGTYRLRLTATSATGVTSSAETVVHLRVNTPPLVDAGPDLQAIVGAPVALAGSAEDDGNPSSPTGLVVRWTQTDGPAPVTMDDPSRADATVVFPVPGTYRLTLSADDSEQTSSDTVTVTVSELTKPNAAPVVAVASPLRVQVGEPLLLGASVFDDGLPSPGSLTYQWSVVAGPATPAFQNPAALDTTVSFPVTGSYQLRVVVSDGLLEGSADLLVDVQAADVPVENRAPSVTLQVPSIIYVGASHDLIASATDDGLPADESLSYAWTKVLGDGPVTFGTPSAATTSVLVGAPGQYVIRVTVSDGDLMTFLDCPLNAVFPVQTNVAPTVSLPASAAASLKVPLTLTGTAVDDGLPAPPAGLSYRWQKVSGPGAVSVSNPTTPSTTVTFHSTGDYVLRLVADDGLLSGFADIAVSVTVPSDPKPPVVSIFEPLNGFVPPATPFEIAARASDPVGAITKVEFFIDGVFAGAQTLPAAGEPDTYFWPLTGGLAQGVYTLTVRATNHIGITAASEPFLLTVSDQTSSNSETVEIHTPLDGDRITAPVEFTGIVARAGLMSWKLEYRLTPANPNASDAAAPWTTFANGTEYAGTPASGDDPAIPASLGTFDPTLLLNGLYQVRLSATSTNGTTLYDFVRTVLVDGKLKLGVIESTVVDLEVPAPGFPLRIERRYSSADRSAGDFGPGATLASSAVRLQLAQELGANWFGYLVSGPLGVPLYRVDPVPPEDATGVPPMPRTVAITLPDQTVLRFEPDLTPKQQIVPISEANVFFRPLAGTTGTLVPLDSSLAPNTEVLLSNVTGDLDLLDVETGAPLDPAAYLLTTLDGTEYIIDAGGSLLSQRDPNGNSITYTHDAIIHSNGLRLDITRDTAGRITRVTDPAGRQVNYTYDASGRLISVADASGHATTYGYAGGSSLVVSVQPPAAIRPTYNAFDALNRFVGRVDAMLGETKLDYDSAEQTKTLRDALGHETVYRYDLLGNVTSITNPLGHVTTYEFGDGRFPDKPTRVTNHLGESVRTTYNAQGRTATVTDPLGRVTSYVYDSAGRLLSETDALGHAVTRTYDARGNVLTVTDRGGGVTSYTYDTAGNPLTVTDALNNVSTFTYNSQGLPLTETETDSAGVVLVGRSFTYDLAGNLLTETIQQTDADGITLPRVTAYTYDAAGRVRTITHPDGRVVSRTYTDSGQLATETTPEHGLVTYAYDAADRLIRVTHADGTTELTGYDALGRVTSRTDRGGFTTTYVYDAAGRLTSEALPDGGVIARVYDAAGRVTSETDDAGRVTATTYDAAGNPTGITHPDGTTTELTYDAANNVATRSVRAFAEPEFAALGGYARSIAELGGRPDAHRLAQAGGGGGGSPVSPSGTPARLFRFTYDANHRLTEVIHPDGVTRATLEYDFLGRPTRVTNERGAVWTYEYQGGSAMRRTRVTGPLGYVENYEYDEYANITAQIDARGRRVETRYEGVKPVQIIFRDIGAPTFTSILNTYDDTTGRLSTVRDRRSFETRFTYVDPNKPDREIIRTEGPSGAGQSHRTREEYDSRGNLVKVTDARGSVTAYEYDAFNRRTLVTHPDGVKERTVYGPGNTVARTEHISASGEVLATSYAYDANGRLSAITHPDGATEHLSFDADGRITGRVDERGNATTYVYDDTARTVTVTDAELGVTRHAFDAVGNLLETTDARGHRTTYEYDLLGRLTSRTEAADTNVARTTRFEYDLNGNVVTRIEAANTPDERITRYAYDSDDRLLLTTFADGTTVRTERDADGNLLARTNERGFVTRSTYDAFGRLTSLTDPLNRVTTYSYPDFGAQAVRTDPLGRVSTDHFDERQRLVRREFDGGAWIENLSYDAFGRLAERRERRASTVSFSAARVTAYAYDARGRVSTVTHPSGGVDRFTYDDAGNIDRIVDPRGFATTFSYDRLNRRVSETRRGSAGETTRTTAFEYDPVGNLTRLTKPGGQVITRTYDQLNRPQVVTATLNATETYSRALLHDVFDRLYATEDDRGRNEFTYDLRDRLITEKDPLGQPRRPARARRHDRRRHASGARRPAACRPRRRHRLRPRARDCSGASLLRLRCAGQRAPSTRRRGSRHRALRLRRVWHFARGLRGKPARQRRLSLPRRTLRRAHGALSLARPRLRSRARTFSSDRRLRGLHRQPVFTESLQLRRVQPAREVRSGGALCGHEPGHGGLRSAHQGPIPRRTGERGPAVHLRSGRGVEPLPDDGPPRGGQRAAEAEGARALGPRQRRRHDRLVGEREWFVAKSGDKRWPRFRRRLGRVFPAPERSAFPPRMGPATGGAGLGRLAAIAPEPEHGPAFPRGPAQPAHRRGQRESEGRALGRRDLRRRLAPGDAALRDQRRAPRCARPLHADRRRSPLRCDWRGPDRPRHHRPQRRQRRRPGGLGADDEGRTARRLPRDRGNGSLRVERIRGVSGAFGPAAARLLVHRGEFQPMVGESTGLGSGADCWRPDGGYDRGRAKDVIP